MKLKLLNIEFWATQAMIGCQIPSFCPLNFNHLACNPRIQKLHRNYTRLVNFEITNPQITIVTESSCKSIQSHKSIASLVRYVCWLSNYLSVFVSHPSHPQFEGRRPAQSQWKPFKDSQCWSVCQAWHWLRQAENSNSYEPLSTGTHFFWNMVAPCTTWNPSLPKVNSPDCQGLNLRSQMMKPSPK